MIRCMECQQQFPSTTRLSNHLTRCAVRRERLISEEKAAKARRMATPRYIVVSLRGENLSVKEWVIAIVDGADGVTRFALSGQDELVGEGLEQVLRKVSDQLVRLV